MTTREKRLIGQLVIGESERRRFTDEMILDALGLAAAAAGLDALLFWPSNDEPLNDRVRRRARELGLELYLWLPVLADTGQEPEPADQTEDAWGGVGQGRSGAWSGLGHGDETFLFACPLSAAYLDAAIGRCRNELPDYDGVFLDRIRYPSFANGLETVFSCLCPRCIEQYQERKAWRERMDAVRNAFARADAASLHRWTDMAGLCRSLDADWAPFERTDAVSGLVARLSRLAREQGKKVGLDLFTPSLAAAVGQDYRTLSSLCDWIKPMSYCHAKGPAGVPLELACFARGLMTWGLGLAERDVMAFVARTFGLADFPERIDILLEHGLDESFAGREYTLAADASSCPVYPGFECVRHPDFDLAMTEDGVRRYLAALENAPGAVLSWNILYSPESFLKRAGEF